MYTIFPLIYENKFVLRVQCSSTDNISTYEYRNMFIFQMHYYDHGKNRINISEQKYKHWKK